MIYISSACVKHQKIKDSVQELVDNGFKNIELTGGTEYYDNFEADLLELKDKYNLNYVCHNYFPPPKEHFVLNLASPDTKIYQQTFEHLKSAIELSKRLGAKKFAFHAGFYINIKVNEIGKKLTKLNVENIEKSLEIFTNGFQELKLIAKDLELYVENNVYSSSNYTTYQGSIIAMLLSSKDYKELKNMIDFNLLLDVAHLKVSSNTLGLNFADELHSMMLKSDYIHISDNDALHDQNNTLKKDSQLVQLLKKQNLKNKDFTLEIYDDMNAIKNTYQILQEVIK